MVNEGAEEPPRDPMPGSHCFARRPARLCARGPGLSRTNPRPHGDFHDEPEGTGKGTSRSGSEILPSSKSSAPIRTRGRAIVTVGLGERLRRTLRVACTHPETRLRLTVRMALRPLLLT